MSRHKLQKVCNDTHFTETSHTHSRAHTHTHTKLFSLRWSLSDCMIFNYTDKKRLSALSRCPFLFISRSIWTLGNVCISHPLTFDPLSLFLKTVQLPEQTLKVKVKERVYIKHEPQWSILYEPMGHVNDELVHLYPSQSCGTWNNTLQRSITTLKEWSQCCTDTKYSDYCTMSFSWSATNGGKILELTEPVDLT